jgi:hypothetical protein
MFAKGANLIPFHVFQSEADRETMHWTLQSAVDANMNMVSLLEHSVRLPGFWDIPRAGGGVTRGGRGVTTMSYGAVVMITPPPSAAAAPPS